MTEVKRGPGRPKKTDVTVTVTPVIKRKPGRPKRTDSTVKAADPVNWRDMAFKVQGALESAIKDIKELEERVSLLHTQNVELTGVIRYLEVKVKDARAVNPV